jgi:hypothetical protein
VLLPKIKLHCRTCKWDVTLYFPVNKKKLKKN